MKLLALTLLFVACLATEHTFKLGNTDDATADDAATKDDAPADDAAADAAGDDAAPADDTAAPADDSAAAAGDDAADDGIKEVTAKVGDVLVFDLPQDKPEGENAGVQEWVFLEGMMGRQGDVWQVVSENMKVNDDESRTFSFGFKILKAGEDVLSFVAGDVSKIDDAISNFNDSEDQTFSVADMKGTAYSQVRIKAE